MSPSSDTPRDQPHEVEPPAFEVGRFAFHSRLIIGTGKYSSFEQNLECAEVSGAEMITVHGRTRHAGGGRRTAAQLANWAWIRAVEAGAEIQFRARAGSTRVGGTSD